MAYVNVAEWKPEQVTEWLKGLDNTVLPYVHSFLNNEINGQQLLNLGHDDLERLGISILGHQEIILEAVEHLRNFHYELDRENLQLLALRLSCSANSLHNELLNCSDLRPVSTRTLCDVVNVINTVKPLVCWLDRPPFLGQYDFQERKFKLLKLSVELATCAQRDRFAEHPIETIRETSRELAELSDSIIQDITDPLILQPASLDLATLKKKPGDDLGFFILPSYNGAHQIAEIRYSSPAHQCGKIEDGDEVVQVNYQTVVGWQTKKISVLFEESLSDVFLTLKKRPRHTKVYGQIYIKPYRLPSKKRAPPYTRWGNLPSPRLELLTISDIDIPISRVIPHILPPQPESLLHLDCNPKLSNLSEDDDEDDEDDEAFLDEVVDNRQISPSSVRLYLPKPRVIVQRRATVTGVSPTTKRPPVDIEQLWAELYIQRRWKGGSEELSTWGKDTLYRLRDKSASFGNSLSLYSLPRPNTCLGIENTLKMKLTRKLESESSVEEEENMSLPSDKAEDMGEPVAVNDKIEIESSEDSQGVCVEKCPEKTPEEDTSKPTGESVETEKKVDSVLTEDGAVSDESGITVSSLKVSASQRLEEIDTAFNFVTSPDKTKMFLTEVKFHVDAEGNTVCENIDPVSASDGTDQLVASSSKTLDDSGNTQQTDPSSRKSWDYPETMQNINASSRTSSDIPENLRQMKERGKLDKSHSTPAYDLSDSTAFDIKYVDYDSKSSMYYEEYKLPDKLLPYTLQGYSDLQESDNMGYGLDLNKSFEKDLDKNFEKEECGDPHKKRMDLAKNMYKCSEHVSDTSGEVNSITNISSLDIKSLCISDIDRSSESTEIMSVKDSDRLYCSKETLTSNDSTSTVNASQQITADIECAGQIVFQDRSQQATEMPEVKNPVSSPKSVSNKPMNANISTDTSGPPVPPPRISVSTHGRKYGFPSGVGYKVAIVAKNFGIGVGMRGLHVNDTACSSSPRSLRRKNALLLKRRKVSVSELGAATCEGWLAHRRRAGGACSGVWNEIWCVLKGTTFYGFKSREEPKALIMISLPGFTVAMAEEVKSKIHALKIYHTGTVFYFAAKTDVELIEWLDSLCIATVRQECVKPDSLKDSVTFSETEDEGCVSDPENDPCVSGLKNKHSDTKLNHNVSYDIKGNDMQKKYSSSLKKNAFKSCDIGDTTSAETMVITSSSLDRKYLRFFGGNRNNVPVPTTGYRCFRRPTAPEKLTNETNDKALTQSLSKLNVSMQSLNSNNDVADKKSPFGETRATRPTEIRGLQTVYDDISKGQEKSSKVYQNIVNPLPVEIKNKPQEKPKLPPPRHLKSKNHPVHLSNPSLPKTIDAYDFRRVAQYRREFEMCRGGPKEDLSNFITLEQLMLENERQRSCNAAFYGQSTSSSINPTSYRNQSESDDLDRISVASSTTSSKQASTSSGARLKETPRNLQLHGSLGYETIYGSSFKYKSNSDFSSGSSIQDFGVQSENVSMSSLVEDKSKSPSFYQKMTLRQEPSKNICLPCATTQLKSAAQYQPPPITQATPSKKVHPFSPTMKKAFEMHLGASKHKTKHDKDQGSSKSSKIFNFFSSLHKNSHSDNSAHSSVSHQKSFSPNPKLRRSIFKEKGHGCSKNSSDFCGGCFAIPTSPQSSVFDWPENSHPDTHFGQNKPTMGISMIGKKQNRSLAQADYTTAEEYMTSPSCSVASDPGCSPFLSMTPFKEEPTDIVFPPVFVPETYSIHDTSALFKNRQRDLQNGEQGKLKTPTTQPKNN